MLLVYFAFFFRFFWDILWFRKLTKKRLRESAPAEIQLVLWPDAKAFRSPVSESELERENENFSLDEVFEKGESTIFPHSPTTLKELFLDGRRLSSSHEVSLVKSFKVSFEKVILFFRVFLEIFVSIWNVKKRKLILIFGLVNWSMMGRWLGEFIRDFSGEIES